ncbi:MAG: RNase adapter RapZ [Thermodesulfobacteriota bacterium]
MVQCTPGPQARFVVITGLSGSGKSTALKALEDLGYYAVDNLPVKLLPAFVKLPVGQLEQTFRAALVIDVRSPKFLETFPEAFLQLVSQGYSLELLFLEASDESLIRRFSQTRRQPPLSAEGESLRETLDRERRLLEPVRALAQQVIDTSRFTVHELRQEITCLFSDVGQRAGLQLNLVSFGYKHGLPQEADLVMDVRFLRNPYFVDDLRDLDGRDPRVVDYVLKEGAEHFLNSFKLLIESLLPRYKNEGKSQLTLALGCTGGRHRSVVVAEWLARNLKTPDVRLTLRHRDVGKE